LQLGGPERLAFAFDGAEEAEIATLATGGAGLFNVITP
jgi:hypothetical protein